MVERSSVTAVVCSAEEGLVISDTLGLHQVHREGFADPGNGSRKSKNQSAVRLRLPCKLGAAETDRRVARRRQPSFIDDMGLLLRQSEPALPSKHPERPVGDRRVALPGQARALNKRKARIEKKAADCAAAFR
jgi:hypothetical protein